MITPNHIRQYQNEGYFILERAIQGADLSRLQERCMHFVDREKEVAASKGMTKHQQDGKFFITFPASQDAQVADFVFGEMMTEIARATAGDDAVLFYDQFVVKGPERGQSFAWHQDSGYVAFPHRPYVTCWVALDDVDEANGTVSILSYARAGTRDRVEHVRNEATSDMVGYHGDDPGIPVIVPAGTIVCFSSNTFHRSGANKTNKPRRSYLCQYSPSPILTKDGSKPWCDAVPFLKDGKNAFTWPPKG